MTKAEIDKLEVADCLRFLEGKRVMTADDQVWLVRGGCYGEGGQYRLKDSPPFTLRGFVKCAIWMQTGRWPQ